MKKTSLKLEIIKRFILSGLASFLLTFITFILFWGTIHLMSTERYNAWLNECNQSNTLMLLNLFGVFIVFCLFFFLFFMKSMDSIRRYIEEMNRVVGIVATGNLEAQIEVKNHNELGQLAARFNEMTHSLKQAREREKQLDQQKYILITNLSHDLKTPMMSIMGFVELIGQKKYTSEAQLEHYCEIVHRKTVQLKEAIDKLFELSKLNNPNMVLHKQRVNMKEMIEQVLMGLTPQLEKVHMIYRLNVPDEICSIEADGALMARVIENLVSNAMKYGADGKYLDISITIQGSFMEIAFENYGPAIPIEEQDRLFGRFYRGEKTFKQKEGNGVGLAIVLTIIELHGGKIEVESNEAHTCFRVVLPFEDKA